MKTRVFLLALASTLMAGNAVGQIKAPAAGLLQNGDIIVNDPVITAPQGGEVCVDFSDVKPSWDLLDDPSNLTIVFDIGAGNAVTGIAWDVNLETVGASWLSEAVMFISDSTAAPPVDTLFLTVGVGNGAPGNMDFSSGGILVLADVGIDPIDAEADGELHLQFFESFDDVADAIDANFTNAAVPAVCGGIHLQCTDQAACDAAMGGGDPAADQARFAVNKDFDDDNAASVEVTLSCNTGLPLEQTTTIEEGDPVNFVIGDFEQGTLNCTVTETPVDGYTASYDDGDGVSDVNCSWEDLIGAQYTCAITNSLGQSEVTVTKEWVDENPSFNPFNVADASWSCSNVAFGPSAGSIDLIGNPANNSFFVYADWETGTTCSVTEVNLPDGGVEVDDSDCQGLTLFPGDSAACTIVNTRLYEGIPTLSQYGLAVLALLMLGMGFVGFRRFV